MAGGLPWWVPYQHYPAVMQVSTVHVYLTYPFVLSSSLLEAMSMGCTIVASDTRPLREAIEHDKTGKPVDFFDVQGIADHITRLLDNPAERQQLGEMPARLKDLRAGMRNRGLLGRFGFRCQIFHGLSEFFDVFALDGRSMKSF